ncbi:MAG: radical SAM protein, partial [Candidatus Margulisiibacteriota bacterium]
MQDISYKVGDSLYLNITNRCTNECSFCIRNLARRFNQKYQLWLDHEPSAEEILEAIGDPTKYKQIVFCGYGEPLIRLDIVKAVAAELKSKIQKSKSKQGIIIRIDTN